MNFSVVLVLPDHLVLTNTAIKILSCNVSVKVVLSNFQVHKSLPGVPQCHQLLTEIIQEIGYSIQGNVLTGHIDLGTLRWGEWPHSCQSLP